MVSINVLYREPLDKVVALWQESCSILGLKQLDENLKPQNGSWTSFKLRNTQLFFGIGESPNGLVWAELFSHGVAYCRFEDVFWKIIRHHPACSEAALLDDDNECSGPMLSFIHGEPDPTSFLQALLVLSTAGTRQIRAIGIESLSSPDRWLQSAREQGLDASVLGNCLTVDVHWEQRGRRVPDGTYRIPLIRTSQPKRFPAPTFKLPPQ